MSKQFKVECLSCGACYADGTLLLISRIGGCYKPTTYPFWKEPKDVTNRVSTRSQLKKKYCVARSYVIEYSNLLQNRMAKYLKKPLQLMLKLIQTVQTIQVQIQTIQTQTK